MSRPRSSGIGMTSRAGDQRHTFRVSSGLMLHVIRTRFHKWFANRSRLAHTFILTLLAINLAIAVDWLLVMAGLINPNFRIFLASSIVTLITVAPVIYVAKGTMIALIEAQKAHSRMSRSLAIAFNNVEQANEAKYHFLANTSHQIRTPLNAIIGFSEIMSSQIFGPMNNPRYVGYAADINASGHHLLAIFNDILDLAKIKSGQAAIEEEKTFSVVHAIKATCAKLHPLAVEQNVQLDIHTPDGDFMLHAVERMVHQVMQNCLSNAIKYSPPGCAVSIVLKRKSDGSLTITFGDKGIGMTHEEIQLILIPFGHVYHPMSKVRKGVGLGIPLAIAMMELHKGALTISSIPDHGTDVMLTFPASRVSFSIPPISSFFGGTRIRKEDRA